jgi:hypothetical protein
MRRTRPVEVRERTIRKRQDPPEWGAGYLPGQLATREEAPDESRPATILSFQLGRPVHCMSEPELYAFVLASYMGKFFELHESRTMSPEPSAGFIHGCPGLTQTYAAAHCGTILAAERLGVLQFHPTIRVPDPSTSKSKVIAFPLLSDQLFFCRDDEGIYGVNWCIKQAPEDFKKAFKSRSPVRAPKSDEAHEARLLIEEEVFRDAGIRTIHVANTDIPNHVKLNLRSIYTYKLRESSLHELLRLEFIETVNARLPLEVPLFETIRSFQGRYGGSFFDYQIDLFTAIWDKKIKCDLWRPILLDEPLRPLAKCLDAHFASWWQR